MGEEFMGLDTINIGYIKKLEATIRALQGENVMLSSQVDELSNYQNFAEEKMRILNSKNTVLEGQIAAIDMILAMSKYLNSNFRDEDLINIINDTLIGILGVVKSSIYLFDNEMLGVKKDITITEKTDEISIRLYKQLATGEVFNLTCKEVIYTDSRTLRPIHSIIGVPIQGSEGKLGYLIAEHSYYDFFTNDQVKFLGVAANQIGVSLENYFLYKKLKETSIRDPLLSLFTRRYLFNLLKEQIERNPSKEFGIVMIDVDNFKKCNDTYGHLFGDQALIAIATVIKEAVEDGDLVARYGGEEMVIYINNIKDRKRVFEKVDDIRRKLSENIITFNGVNETITASFGVSYYPKDGNTIEEVLSAADSMLYRSKIHGKNMVTST